MKKYLPILFSVTLLWACSSSGIKENINKAGNVAGQTAGEFIQGASKGVEKAFDIKVSLPDPLKSKGIEFGKASITSDSSGTDNVLLLYVIFNQDFSGTFTAKAFDEQSLEMGRVSLEVNGKKDETRYVEFHFGKHTNIDSKNKVTVE